MSRLENIKIKRTNNKRYYSYIKYPDIPLSSNDLYVLTSVGDRLDSLAHQFYGDVNLWWVIATANPQNVRRDSIKLKPGIEIRIPANISDILVNFNNENE